MKDISVYNLSQIPAGYIGYVFHNRGLGRDSYLYFCNGKKADLTFIEAYQEYNIQPEQPIDNSFL